MQGGGQKERKNLDNTARILKLRKIKKYFTPVHTGDREKREKEEKEKQTLNLPVSCATSKLGWGGEFCTVQQEDTYCVSQSEGVSQPEPKNHLGLLGLEACDWIVEDRKGNATEDVIGGYTGGGGV